MRLLRGDDARIIDEADLIPLAGQLSGAPGRLVGRLQKGEALTIAAEGDQSVLHVLQGREDRRLIRGQGLLLNGGLDLDLLTDAAAGEDRLGDRGGQGADDGRPSGQGGQSDAVDAERAAEAQARILGGDGGSNARGLRGQGPLGRRGGPERHGGEAERQAGFTGEVHGGRVQSRRMVRDVDCRLIAGTLHFGNVAPCRPPVFPRKTAEFVRLRSRPAALPRCNASARRRQHASGTMEAF